MKDRLISALRAALGEKAVLTAPEQLHCYSFDASFAAQLKPCLPDVVVQPSSPEDVAKAVRIAAELGVPVTPRGAATGQSLGCVPVRGGMVIDLSRLNRILELDADNLQVFAEPGVVHADLNAYLARYGLFFPPDPGSSRMCTIGGMVANNSRGMRAIKYGATSEYVLGMDVVLADGQMITTGSIGSRSLHSASGFELTKLFVGAEGLLGIIVRLRLKVLPLPPARGLTMALFDRLENTGPALLAVFRAGIIPSAVEILDSRCIQAANIYRPGLNLPEVEAMLLFEVDGNPPGVAYDAECIAKIVADYATQVEWSTDPKRINALWEGRSVIGAAVGAIRPGGVRVYAGEDICVPITRVAEALRRIQEIGDRHGIAVASYGHIGAGTIHAGLVGDPLNPDEVGRLEQVADEINRLALELGGTVTGEHGVGVVRAVYMRQEHGPALDVMLRIKEALDPAGILNPGKVFACERAAARSQAE